jgi:hypothetical protein
MNPLVLKFLKHAGFVVAGAAVSGLASLATGDQAVAAFVKAHPFYAGIVPVVAGALGSFAKWLEAQ